MIEAIRAAQQDQNQFENLFRLLHPLLFSIARRIAPQIVDDAIQVAKIRVWKKLHKVDMARPETARAYIVKAAVTGMRDEIRRYLRSIKGGRVDIESVDPSVFQQEPEPDKPEFDGTILAEYVDYIEKTGDFAGAHKAVATARGVTTARASTLFHEASRDFIKNFRADN